MSNKQVQYGDILATRTSWSSQQLFSTFGLDHTNKPMLGIDDAGEALLNYLIPLQQWIYLQDAITQLRSIVDEAPVTYSFKIFSGQLQQLWDTYVPLMEATPNEKDILANLLQNIKDDFKQAHGTVGCKKLKRSFIINTCNLFRTFST